MWAEACALLDEAEQRHRHFFERLAAPAADVFSTETELYIRVALPGARAEDIRVGIVTAGLVIETTVPPPMISTAMHVVRLEIPYGLMRRRIELPPGRYSLREQRFENGNLHLCIAELTP